MIFITKNFSYVIPTAKIRDTCIRDVTDEHVHQLHEDAVKVFSYIETLYSSRDTLKVKHIPALLSWKLSLYQLNTKSVFLFLFWSYDL